MITYYDAKIEMFRAAEHKEDEGTTFLVIIYYRSRGHIINIHSKVITDQTRYKLSKTAKPAATPPSSDEDTFVRIK